MTTTARLGFTLWETGQIQPNTVYNDLAAKVDLWLTSGVKSRTTDAQPGSPVPAEGDAYIMTASASGAAWGAFTENYLAFYVDGSWTQYAPPGRISVYVDDESQIVTWNGTAWSATSVDAATITANVAAVVWDLHVETVANQDYEFTFDAPYPGTVSTLRTKTQSGTCTVTGYVVDNTTSPQTVTAFGGSANSASTTAEEQSHTASSPLNNSWAKGDTVKITVTSNSSATDLVVTLYGSRTDL